MAYEANKFTGIITFSPRDMGRIMVEGLAPWERPDDEWVTEGRIVRPYVQPDYAGLIALEVGEPERIFADVQAEIREHNVARWQALDSLRYGTSSEEDPYINWDV